MVGIFKYGERSIGSPDQRVLIGDASNSFFQSPTRVYIYSSSEDDTVEGVGSSQILLTGLDGEGNRISEFLSVLGQNNSFSKNEYIYLNKIVVHSGGSNQGTITLLTETGHVVGTMKPWANQIVKADYAVGNKEGTQIKGFGASALHITGAEPILVYLMSYHRGRRTTLCSWFVSTEAQQCVKQEFSTPITLRKGEIVSIEAMTAGTQVLVSAWLEIEEED